MISNRQLQVLVFTVLAALAVVLFMQGNGVPLKDFYNAFSYVVTAVAFILILWERYLWHWWPFYPYLQKKPDLRGTWKGQLDSNYEDPDVHQRKPPIEVYIVVRQTYSIIDLRLFSAESSSVSLSGGFFSDNADLYTLACTYRNTPTVLRRRKSPISHGGLLLYVRGTPIHQLDGEYWTDRNTAGEIVFTHRADEEAHDFAQAQGLKFRNAAGR
ncbi:MAG: hypothetical protein WA213_02710 [Terriglobales bacterium]